MSCMYRFSKNYVNGVSHHIQVSNKSCKWSLSHHIHVSQELYKGSVSHHVQVSNEICKLSVMYVQVNYVVHSTVPNHDCILGVYKY